MRANTTHLVTGEDGANGTQEKGEQKFEVSVGHNSRRSDGFSRSLHIVNYRVCPPRGPRE